jgi:apolipoprotein N-acyltransferase
LETLSSFGRTRLPVGAPAPWWGFLLAGFGYGAMTALAFPPVGVWPLALVALIPLVWAGCRAGGRTRTSALLVMLGVMPMLVLEHWWLLDVTGAGMPLLCLYVAAYPALFVWIIAHARRADWAIPMSVIAPIVWTSLEVLRGEIVLTGYCWFLAGHPLIESQVLSAPAAIIGAYGVSFLVAALAGTVVDAAGWSGIPRSRGAIGATVLLLAWPALGLMGELASRPSSLIGSGERGVLRVAVIQTNVPQSNKMFSTAMDRLGQLRRFIELTRRAAVQRPAPDVICWPETMFPGPALNAEATEAFQRGDVRFQAGKVPFSEFAEELTAAQAELGIPMLVGAETRDGDVLADLNASRLTHSSVFNSVVLVDHGRALGGEGRYDKVRLMPFGEVIPWTSWWPGLQRLVLDVAAQGMRFDLSPGTRVGGVLVPIGRSTFGASRVRIATPICFEATWAGLCRDLVRGNGGNRSSLMINFSNDGWFGGWNAGRRQHLLAARWRCVELAVPMVRCVNTGVSCQIDPAGRIVNQRLLEDAAAPEGANANEPRRNAQTEGILMATVPLDPGHTPTVFERVGLVPAYIVMVAGLVGAGVLWRRSRRTGGV